MVGGGGAQGRRGQARCPGAELPGIEKAVETGPGSWGRGHVFCSPPWGRGAAGEDQGRQVVWGLLSLLEGPGVELRSQAALGLNPSFASY